MRMTSKDQTLPWLEPGQVFPPASQAWGTDSAAPGLLCAGGDLSTDTLQSAYTQGIFPWFSTGQPILWWSPQPRMVLHTDEFRLHPSLKKTLKRFVQTPACEIRVDTAFEQVIRACSASPRDGQAGTWILPDMINAYCLLHDAGMAHSIETWINGELVAGLYFVAIGRAVFGESMFHRATDGSKIALAGLVAMCRHHGITVIDCQQNTRHLKSLGAREISRETFVSNVKTFAVQAGPEWSFEPVYWQALAASPHDIA
jgi:leucyl/phenylalanyl-tRNA--protein transferase